MISMMAQAPVSYRKALEGCSCEIQYDVSIAPYTSLKIGGPADVMAFPKTVTEVVAVMKRVSQHQLPFFVLGGGSNVLVLDGGIEGVVIQLDRLNRITRVDTRLLFAEAGVSYPKLSTHAMGCGLSGLEFAAGIPGTVGGAVAMNAGIPGEETWEVLKEIAFVDDKGEFEVIPAEYVRHGYRSAALPKGVVVSACFSLSQAPVEQIEETIKGLMKRRRETQPLSFPNVGSIFKNPAGAYTGRLVEEVGLKGYSVGGAQISDRHGNFIINRDNALARDVLDLIKKVVHKVRQERGVKLELEVRIVGRE